MVEAHYYETSRHVLTSITLPQRFGRPLLVSYVKDFSMIPGDTFEGTPISEILLCEFAIGAELEDIIIEDQFNSKLHFLPSDDDTLQ